MVVGYFIECRMPGCDWRTRNPGEYIAVEARVTDHVLKDHTAREVVEALISFWQYKADGHRQEQGDPLIYVPEQFEQEKGSPSLPPAEPRKKRHSGGSKRKFDKTYARMVLDAFAAGEGAVLTTTGIRKYMEDVTGAIIPTASVCATLHKLCEDSAVEHVATGQWRKNASGP